MLTTRRNFMKWATAAAAICAAGAGAVKDWISCDVCGSYVARMLPGTTVRVRGEAKCARCAKGRPSLSCWAFEQK